MARVELTDEQLRSAYEERKRSDWPASYEEAMQHPTYSRLVRMHASHDAVMARMVVHRPVVQPPEPPPPRTTARPLSVPRHPPILDHKRAAAGERDDD